MGRRHQPLINSIPDCDAHSPSIVRHIGFVRALVQTDARRGAGNANDARYRLAGATDRRGRVI